MAHNPKLIEIDGKHYFWSDIVERRRQQLAACRKPDTQIALFQLKDDFRPPVERKAADRYLPPSLLNLLDP